MIPVNQVAMDAPYPAQHKPDHGAVHVRRMLEKNKKQRKGPGDKHSTAQRRKIRVKLCVIKVCSVMQYVSM